jgi:hypothetical protein
MAVDREFDQEVKEKGEKGWRGGDRWRFDGEEHVWSTCEDDAAEARKRQKPKAQWASDLGAVAVLCAGV